MPRKSSKKGMGKRRSYGKRRGGSKARQGINASYTAPKGFTETIKFKDIISLPGSSGPGGTAFDMSLTANTLPLLNGNLSQIYRQYQIRGIKITYQPSFNNYPQTAGVAQAPKMYFAEDKTAVVPDLSSVNTEALLQQDNVRVLSPFRKWTEYVKFPKPLLQMSTNETGTSGSIPEEVTVQLPSNRPMWLSLQNQTENALEVPGLALPHLIGRLVTDDNNSAVAITLGKLYYKVYYPSRSRHPERILPMVLSVRFLLRNLKNNNNTGALLWSGGGDPSRTSSTAVRRGVARRGGSLQ